MDSKVALCVIYLLLPQTNTQDPCDSSNHKKIEAEDKRSASYIFDYTIDNAFSDDRLAAGWYRILNEAGEDMPTSSPGTFRCGTWYPIWLNGQLPSTSGEEVTRPVCMETHSDACARTWDINIKRCSGGFLVYKLESSPVIDSGYCFGNSTKCPNGTSSETGYTPCTSEFPVTILLPEVLVSRQEGTITSGPFKNQELVFSCSFANTNYGYVYDVHWYINGYSVKTTQRVAFSSISETDLRPADWVNSHHMNMVVKCSVRARQNATSVPGNHFYSEDFVAGVISDKYVYEVDEGGSIELKIRSTVPLGCVGKELLEQCKETIKLGYPRNESCSLDSTLPDVITETCGADISAVNWNEDHTIIVYGNVDNLYNDKSVRTAVISFLHVSSDKDPSKAWDRVDIPNIYVHIKDRDTQLSGKSCITFTDPNYRTFDQKSFSSQVSGEYVLYRHKREPYWVHTLSSACWSGTCNVGVAVRSHNSLFVVRTFDVIHNPSNDPFTATFSGSRTFPVIDFRHCDDKSMLISRDGSQFTVTLPSGTEIKFTIQRRWSTDSKFGFYIANSVTIKPSILDIEQTEGLCGFLSSDGSQADDFKERNTGNIVSKNTFVNSWAISSSSSESLFAESPEFTNDQFYKGPFCTCARQATGRTPIADNFNEVNCNLSEPLEHCYDTTTNIDDNLYTTCSSRKRRDVTLNDGQQSRRYTRSVNDNDDIVDEPTPLSYSTDYQENYLPPELSWPGNWTEDLARSTCTNGFQTAPAVTICQQYANSETESFILGCMTDIKATGSTVFMDSAIGALISACVTEISRNQSLLLSEASTGDSNSRSLLDSIKSQLCFNNCSGNGKCTKAKCNCYDGFMGDDCSLSKTQPPSGLVIPGEGKCGTRQRSCRKSNIYGIFESADVWCKLLHFEVVNNVKQSSSSPELVKAEVLTPVKVSCPFPSTRRRKRSVVGSIAEGYDISLSNDGTIFSEHVTLIIYDEECYSCNPNTVTCSALSTCTSTTTVSSDSSKEEEDQDDERSESDDKGKNKLGPIIGVIIGLSVVVLVSVIVWWKCKKHNKKSTFNKNKCSDNYALDVQVTDFETNPPLATDWYERSYSSSSLQWLTERPKTPEHLFLAK